MNVAKYTKSFIVIMIVVIAGYDVWAWNKGGTEGTISWVMYQWSLEAPVFTFAMGFVMGHLFWQMKKSSGAKELKDG